MKRTIGVITTALFATTLATGCGHKVEVSMLRPADVDLPDDLQTVIVINRANPKNAGEEILAFGEGAVTGEGWAGDRYTSEVAIDGLLAVLEDSPRFEVVRFRVDGKEVDTSIWDTELDWRKVRKLCRKADCDAVIALDSLDADTVAHVIGDANTRDFTATQDTDLVASFRVYDADDKVVRDYDRVRLGSSSESWAEPTPDAAVNGLPSTEAQAADLAWQAGQDYGYRIAPGWVMVQRSYYKTGAPEFANAVDHVKAGNWDRAMNQWRKIARNEQADPVLRGKARYNLAVAHEARGNLDDALKMAKRAAWTLDRTRVNQYIAELDYRLDAHAEVIDQLDNTPGEDLISSMTF